MRILKIIHGYPPLYNAGSEVYSQSLCEELSKHNEVFVFTREENPYEPDFTIRKSVVNKNLTVFYVNMAQGKDGYRHQKLDAQLEILLGEIRPDVAHIGHLNHLSTGFIDVLNHKNIPIVFTLHDFWLMCPRGQFIQRSFGADEVWTLCDKQEDKKCAISCYNAYFSSTNDKDDIAHWTKWVGKRMLETKTIIEKVDLFIAPSQYLRNRFINEFNVAQNKIIFLDYGFPVEYLTPTLKSKHEESYTFGYIGTHIPAKGINLLINAFNKLKGNAKLCIWGRKNEQSTRELMHMAEGAQLPVEFKGPYVNKNLGDEVFSHVDCIVVPSIWSENSPLVIHEAQACKIPVITADIGGMSEYVNHKINGLLFEHRNEDDLSSKMQWAIENKTQMEQFGSRGYLYNEQGNIPGISEHCEKLNLHYQNLIKKSHESFWRITIDTNPEDCNLSCIMCEEHSQFSTYIDDMFKQTGVRKRRMPIDWLAKIFSQAVQAGVKEIIPSTMGEPLIYSGIERFFELATKSNIKVNLTTNGTFPRKTVAEWASIIIPNTTDVKISWNGSTRETMEAIMKGSSFDKTVKNVKEFVAFRDEHYHKTGQYCKVTFQLTFMRNNMHELSGIIKLAAELNIDRVKGHHLWAHFDEIKSLSMKSNNNSIATWNGYVNDAILTAAQYRRPNGKSVILENIFPLKYNEEEIVPEHYECPFLKKELWISATGKISPCCAPDKLRDTLGDFGNIQNTSIEDVLISDTYNNLVTNYKQHQLCKSCNMRKPS